MRGDWVDEMLVVLEIQIRLATCQMVSTTWWDSTAKDQEHCRRKLAELVRTRYLESSLVLAHPLVRLDAPILKWFPGEPDPPFGKLSYQLQVRYAKGLVPTRVYIAPVK